MSATCLAHLILLAVLEEEYDYCQSPPHVIFCIPSYFPFFRIPYHIEVLFFHMSTESN